MVNKNAKKQGKISFSISKKTRRGTETVLRLNLIRCFSIMFCEIISPAVAENERRKPMFVMAYGFAKQIMTADRVRAVGAS